MATTIFPQNDPNPVDETDFQKLVRSAQGYSIPRRDDDFEITSTSGLDIDVSAGQGLVGGTFVDIPAVTLTAPDDATRWLFIKLERSSGLVQDPATDEDNFVFVAEANIPLTTGPGGNNPEDFLPLYRIITSSGAITQIDDMRWFSVGSSAGFANSIANSKTSDAAVAKDEDAAFAFYWLGNSGWHIAQGTIYISGGWNDGGFRFIWDNAFNNAGEMTYRAYDLGTHALVDADHVNTTSEVAITGGTNEGLIEFNAHWFGDLPSWLHLKWAQDTTNASATTLDHIQAMVGTNWVNESGI